MDCRFWTRNHWFVAILIFVASQSAQADQPSECPCCRGVKTSRSGAWIVRETPCFRVYTLAGQAGVTHLPGTCESLRTHLQTTWLGEDQAAWTPKCDIVLHPTVESYRRQLGPGSEQSSGCASLKVDSERVVQRRIDVRADATDWLTAALPHELTHVVVADRFTSRQIPRWADEGMAILAEPHAKQLVRQREMEACIARGLGFSPSELARISDYPNAERRNAFYGQSAALVAHLAKQESPARFLEQLVEATQREGTSGTPLPISGEVALRSWRFVDAHVASSEPKLAQTVSTIVTTRK